MPEHALSVPTNVVDLMHAAGVVSSKREARRLIEQKGVRLDGAVVESIDIIVEPGKAEILQVGRRRFVHLAAE